MQNKIIKTQHIIIYGALFYDFFRNNFGFFQTFKPEFNNTITYIYSKKNQWHSRNLQFHFSDIFKPKILQKIISNDWLMVIFGLFNVFFWFWVRLFSELLYVFLVYYFLHAHTKTTIFIENLLMLLFFVFILCLFLFLNIRHKICFCFVLCIFLLYFCF